MSPDTKIALWYITAVILLLGFTYSIRPTEQELWERSHPCVSGIRYLRSNYAYTPMIDPNTMSYMRCPYKETSPTTLDVEK